MGPPPPCRFAWALQLVVLTGTAIAWATGYVHAFKTSIWALAVVVIDSDIVSLNGSYLSLDSAVSTVRRLCRCAGPCANTRLNCLPTDWDDPASPVCRSAHAHALPVPQGALRASWIVQLVGFSLTVGGNYLTMCFGDAL